MKRILSLLALAFAVGSPTSVRADTIDLFNSPASGGQVLSVAAGGGNPANAGPLELGGLANVFGGFRSIQFSRHTGAGQVGMNVNTTIASNVTLGNDPATASDAKVIWDYTKSGPNVDFSGAVNLFVDNIDVDTGTAGFSFTLSNGVISHTLPLQNVVGPATDVDLTFSLAGVPASILNNVASLTFNIFTASPAGSTVGTDLAVDNITTEGPITRQNIPEPASICAFVVLAGGLLAGGIRRRKTA